MFLNPIWEFRGSIQCHVRPRLIGKLMVDFPFVLIKLFSLGVTPEALQTNIDWKLAFSKWVGQFRPNFHIVREHRS